MLRKTTRSVGPGAGAPGGAHRERRPDGAYWLYGLHSGLAAAANPRRRVLRLAAVGSEAARLTAAAERSGVARPTVELIDRPGLTALLPAGAVHQGVAVRAAPLPAGDLDALLAALPTAPETLIVVVDQASDPRNVGAVLRSAAGFGAAAVVVQDRHAAPETAVLAKAASGALETVPMLREVNLARTLRRLRAEGCFCLGLDGAAADTLAEASLPGRCALVVGAEGSGLRRLVRETCDATARIPLAPAVDSLNLSVAAAIAMYAWRRARE